MTIYRAVGNRCAVNFEAVRLPISVEEALVILERQGFQLLAIDLVGLARGHIRKASYRRGARMSEAPQVFDCSSFTKWCYGWRGIWLPRRSIQQRECGVMIESDEVVAGDLIFTSGKPHNYHVGAPTDGVGHVGIVTGEGTIIHATGGRSGVVEDPMNMFMDGREFRGLRRLIPRHHQVWTFVVPVDKEVETSDDVRWIIFEALP